MANGWYEAGLRAFANKEVDWDIDDIRVSLLRTAYSVNLATHDFYDDVVADEIADAGASVANSTVTGAGVLDADDFTFTAVTGTEVSYIIVSLYNATDSARALLFYIDTAGANLPFTPNGSDVTIQWSSGGSKIAQL